MARNPNDVGRATRGVLASPSDSASVAETAAIQIKTAGAVAVAFVDAPSTSVALGTLAAGAIYPYAVVRVYDTGTDADVILLY